MVHAYLAFQMTYPMSFPSFCEMEPKKSEHLNKRGKEIVKNVYEFCRKEEREGISVSLKSWLVRTELMTGVNRRTIQRVLREVPESQEVEPPVKQPPRHQIVLDDFDLCVIRRTIQTMYEEKKVLPTLSNIRELLVSKIEYSGSITTLRKVLKSLGFTYKRCTQNRKVLMERPDVVSHRIRFLRQIKTYREDGRPIIYTDETYVHTSHSASKCWQSKDLGLKVPFGKGERMIVVHAGGSTGFIPGGLLTFKSGSSTGDYHDDMNSQNFTRWLREQLIPNLPEKSILVLDNAAYHNIQIDRCPTMAARKGTMQDWLRRNNVPFDERMLKVELLHLCKTHKSEPRYVVDEMLKEHGHTAIRLPPYHADLNPIELIWANLKGFIGRRNLSFNLGEVKHLIQEGIDRIDAKTWSDCCRHVSDKDSEYWKADIAVEDEIERIMVQIGPDSDVSSDDEDSVAEDTAEMHAEDSATGETTDTAGEEGETTETAGEEGETTDTADEIC